MAWIKMYAILLVLALSTASKKQYCGALKISTYGGDARHVARNKSQLGSAIRYRFYYGGQWAARHIAGRAGQFGRI